jgi:two-component system CheB/CheR fusion protein
LVERRKPAQDRDEAQREAGLDPSRFPLVGIGASAGGLEALEQFVSHIIPDANMAYLVVTHQAAGAPTLLPELLQRRSPVPVVTVEDGAHLTPNFIYLPPPGFCLTVTDERTCVTPLGAGDRHLPIDLFFRSLAKNEGENAVGIVLSGTGSDGTLGVQEIKGAGGLVMAQDPDTARYGGMPRSAIDSQSVDYILAPEKMPEQLARYASGRFVHAGPPSDVVSSRGDELARVLHHLRSRTRNDFSGYKKTTVLRRIERRMAIHGLGRLSDYGSFLEKNPLESDALFKELLISVTSFFRDPEAFVALEEELRSIVDKKQDERPLRMWIPACANGAEAYSIAILISDVLHASGNNFGVQIFATDVDPEVIETARVGRFPEGIAADVSRERLARFFVREDSGYRISKDIRGLLIFAVQNVIKDPPFTRLDLLSCRNLLIYFEPELQRRVLALFSYSIRPDGLLFLGSAEGISGFEERFAELDKKAKIYRIKSGVSLPLYELPLSTSSGIPAERAEAATPSPQRAAGSIAPLAERVLLADHVPPTAIIDEAGELIYLHGRTGPFLEPVPGEPSNNVFQMARDGLRLELPIAVRQASTQLDPVVRQHLVVSSEGGAMPMRLSVRRLTHPEALRGTFALTFEAESEWEPRQPKKAGKGRGKNRKEPKGGLELELQRTRETLQGTIEELETSNEELKSTNEELQSTNEELQSANEELETSREELQSLNEELQTVNAEFEERNRELAHVADDMQNLLNSTEIATVFLNQDLTVKRFTSPAKKVFGLIDSDVGRPLAHFATNLRFDGMLEDAEEVLRTLVFREREIQTKSDEWRLMRIMPYRTHDNLIDGLVMTFVDVDRVKRAEEAAQRARHHAEAIVEAVPGALLVLDERLCVVSANTAFYRLFRITPERALGIDVEQLDGSWDDPTLIGKLRAALEGNVVSSFEVSIETPDGATPPLRCTARRIVSHTAPPLLLLTFDRVE